MLSSLSATIAMALATPLVSSLDGISEMKGEWERWSFKVTNTESVARDVRICPQNVTMTLHGPANSKTSAFALAFGEDSWSYECVESTVSGGESVDFKAYIRPFGKAGLSRTVTVLTADGEVITPAS